MLTLQELKKIPDVPGHGVKTPTARQLKVSGLVVVWEKLRRGAEITVYQNGYVLYQADGHSTVFPLDPCGDYLYLSGGEVVRLPEEVFSGVEWYLRLVLEGEDRLDRNQREKERSWNISYSAISEGWAVMEDLAVSVLGYLEEKETVAEILQSLTEKQRYVVQRYYLQGETQAQISEGLGISQQAVSEALSQAFRNIRKRYPSYQEFLANGVHQEEGSA